MCEATDDCRTPGPDDLTCEHYRARQAYFLHQGRQLWTRFNFFLVAEGAVFVAYLARPSTLEVQGLALVSIGFLLSVLWFVVAAQDVFFFASYRQALIDLERRSRNGRLLSTWDSRLRTTKSA
jgi:hypothetical protein